MNSNFNIFKPNHINNEARLEEDTGGVSDQNKSDNSVSYRSSQSSASSPTSC